MYSKYIKKSIGIIADDLTGAADTGLQFKKVGLKTLVLTNISSKEIKKLKFYKDDIERVPVLAINSESRDKDPEKAYELVSDLSTLLNNRNLIYKKLDSALRGNIGSEIDAIMDSTKINLTIFSAAFPQLKRYTINGIHYINSSPLASSEFSKDPINPVKNSNVIKIIQEQSKKKVALISHEFIQKGVEFLTKKIIDTYSMGYQILAFDAVTDYDLLNISSATLKLTKPYIFAGSAGLAEALINILSGFKNSLLEKQNFYNTTGSVLIVSGSVSKINKKQIDFLQNSTNTGILRISVNSIILKEYKQKQKIDQEIDFICSIIKEKKTAIITVEKDLNSNGHIAKQVVKTLAGVTKRIFKRCYDNIGGIILIGGDTANAVIKSLGASGLWIDDEVSSGIPFGRIYKGPYEGCPIITKSGSFGEKETLKLCLEYFSKYNNKNT